jgi:capsular polysaccharide biosynthesis protein
MGERALDLRRSLQMVRRHKVLVCVVVVFGLLAGSAYSVLKPPQLTGTALIVLPQSSANAEAAQSGSGSTSAFTATQMIIANSIPVLSDALPNIRPVMSVDQLRSEIKVSSLTVYIISVSATSKVAADAEATANAVANSYVAYVNSPTSPTGQMSAHILQRATSATGTKPLKAILTTGLLGGVAGALIGVIIALAISRADRRLRQRDEIASSIGIPVLASFPVRHPNDAAGWTKLLDDYQPESLHAWRLRHVLHQLRMADGYLVNGYLANGHQNTSSSLTVLSLSSDPKALAIGPQLAVFAASLGIPTVLFIGPQQDTNVTAALRTACTVPPSASSKRSSYLQVIVSDDGHTYRSPENALTVSVEAVDSHDPQIPDMLRTTATVLGVSAGVATSEQLARIAVSAATDGREIVGILVADPESGDRTTGRVAQLSPPPLHRKPTRLKGMTTEIRR